MELSEALFSLVHTVRINMKHEIKLLALDLSPMHLKALKVISIIKELVNQELITKIDNEKDKRSQFLVLSTQGTEIMTMFKKVEKKVFNSMIKDIPSAKIEDFIAITQLLKSNLT